MQSQPWMELAQAFLVDAKNLYAGSAARSAASRAYYSAFAATHALLQHFSISPPARRTSWAHRSLSTELWGALRGSGKMGKFQAKVFVDGLAAAYSTRIEADYKPGFDVTLADAKDAIGRADELVRLAKGYTT